MKKVILNSLKQAYDSFANITPDQYIIMFISIAIKLSYGFIFLSGLFLCSIFLDVMRIMKRGENLWRAIIAVCLYCHLIRMIVYFILLYIGAWTLTLCDGDDIYFRFIFYGVMYLEVIALDTIYEELTGKSFINIFRKLIKEKVQFWKKR